MCFCSNLNGIIGFAPMDIYPHVNVVTHFAIELTAGSFQFLSWLYRWTGKDINGRILASTNYKFIVYLNNSKRVSKTSCFHR